MNDLPTTVIGTLRLFATTQVQVDRMSDLLIQEVKEGNANPLEVLIQLRAIEKVSGRVLKEIQENILREADKYAEKSFEFNSCKLEKAELGTKYDFTVCGDPVWEQRVSIMNAAKTLVDERQEFLKSLKEPITIVDEGSGEVATIRPPLKTSTSGVKVSIK